MKRHIPNLITLLNLFSGCIAVVLAVQNQLELAALFVFLGIFFDFFDGLAARTLKVQSEIGLQLDSLADMVTSGVVPGIAMYQMLRMSQGGFVHDWSGSEVNGSMVWVGEHLVPLALAGFLITLSSAYRLAKFNIDDDQKTSFKGLPTPANALFILSLPLIMLYQGNDMINQWLLNPWVLLVITLLSTYMLNAPVRLFALKFKSWGMKGNGIRYTFLLLALVMAVTMKYLAIPVIIVSYVLLSLVENMLRKGQAD
ncbi:CDP-alcohol phosphatidyltransferase family protein [Robertkochia flava]|uniref:CDP-alcohol phosphatidyltransferase family protein n=1 Tax=Robertkochia flava TaxID=3447986 RepID=UPI001CCA26F6|nr:CDP-alcohol phosphatidyltransferase family protein [Robertkochia marina]